jgi:hypothetical protein
MRPLGAVRCGRFFVYRRNAKNKKEGAMLVPLERIEKTIYFLREKKVILDRDLAELYGVETRVLNQAVRRNIRRFPDDFLLQLSRDEIRDLSQFVTSPGFKHAPKVFAFTEQGVAMLSSVLNSDRAIEVNIQIMRAFVKLREMVASHKDLAVKLEELEKKYDQQFAVVFDAIRQMMKTEEKGRKSIGFMVEEDGGAYV